jgi:hypothetical protein
MTKNKDVKPIVVCRFPTFNSKDVIEKFDNDLHHYYPSFTDDYYIFYTQGQVDEVKIELYSVRNMTDIKYNELKEQLLNAYKQLEIEN